MKDKDLLVLAAKAADDKRAEDMVVLNMQGISPIADKQVQAIAREIKAKAHEFQIDVQRMEGFDEARWVLVDLGDVVAHVFHKDERNHYNLERLWGDVPREDITEELGQ